MAGVLLQVLTDKPGASLVTLLDAEPSTTGYTLRGNVDLGNATWNKVYSGQRGTQGATLAGAEPQNRLSSWRLLVAGTSKDDLYAKLAALWQLDEELRRFGGVVTWRAWGASFKTFLRALDAGVALEPLEPDLFVRNNRAHVVLGVVSPPYMEGEPLDITDDFSVYSLDQYTFDTGNGSEVTVNGGQLQVSSAPTVEKRPIHTGRGYTYGDVQATVKAAPGSTISSFLAGVVLKRVDASNYLRVYVDDNGTNSRLRIDTVVAGVTTNRATTNLGSRVANGVPFWVRGRVEGINVFAEYFTAAPTPMSTPTLSAVYSLASGEQPQFGPPAVGRAGLVWVPQQSAAWLDDFAVEPYTYRNRTLPDRLELAGPIPGDAPALADAYVTPSGGSAAAIWAMLGWTPRAGAYNYVWNGDFENALLGTAPWSVATVTNISVAATSITRITTGIAKYGVCSGQVVCPATASSGPSFRIFRRFKKGVTYTAEAWIHSAAGTTPVRAILGNSAANDVFASGNVVLSSVWQRITVAWTPSADRDDAHVALTLNAATATTFEIDGVMVYEGAAPPPSPNQSEGRGGFPPVGIIEAENFAVALTTTNEIQQVTPPQLTSGSFTLTFQGQTTATISFDTAVGTPDASQIQSALEALSNIAPGDIVVTGFGISLTGAPLPGTVTFVGAYLGTNVTQMTSGGGSPATVTTLVDGGVAPIFSDAAYRSGVGVTPTLVNGLFTAKTVIDPALLVPDDYTQNEIAIEVWGRQTCIPSAQVVRISAWPVTASAAVAAVTTEEYGAVGKLVVPAASGSPLRFIRLGTLRLRTDLGRYLLVWESPTSGSQLDYFVLVPASGRALSPTGKVGDSTFPSFVSATTEITKRVRSDLSGTIREPVSGTPEVNAPGLGGSLLELQPGDTDLVVKLGSLVPDDPTNSSAAEQLAHSATVHLAVTPRWHLGRAS